MFASLIARIAFKSIPGVGLLSTIGSVIGAILKGVFWLIKWSLKDLHDGLNEWPRIVVRTLFGLIMLAVGFTLGVENQREEADMWQGQAAKWETAHGQLMKEAKDADVKDKTKFDKAVAAKDAAAAAEKAKIAGEAASSSVPIKSVRTQTVGGDAAGAVHAARPDRVRNAKKQRPAANPNGNCGPGLPWWLCPV